MYTGYYYMIHWKLSVCNHTINLYYLSFSGSLTPRPRDVILCGAALSVFLQSGQQRIVDYSRLLLV